MVADPAANPSGLFSSTPSALAEQATAALNEAAEIHGEERVRGFLRTYLGQKPQEVRVDIEALKKQHAEELAARDAKLAAVEAGLKAAEERSKAIEARESERRKAEIDSRLAKLKEQALPNAIAEADLGHVRALLERGDDALAERVGKLLVDGAKAPSIGGKVIPLGAGAQSAAKANTEYLAAQLRESGWTVELSADGTQITKQTPPAAQRAGR
jgi:Skp family chaperone for outer membrane proteins